MNIRSFIKLFVPPIVVNCLRDLRRLWTKLDESPLPQIPHHSKEIMIIGNGPSLSDSVSKYLENIKSKDCIVVNQFASTSLYDVLKPNIYLLADPAYFYVPDHLTGLVWNTIHDIHDKTVWPLRLIVPLSARSTPTIDFLCDNKNIQIDYYNNRNQDVGKMDKFEAWDRNYIAPPAQTVLNTALYLALFWRYENVFLIGADSSFFEDLRIDQDSNDICSVDSHFYKKKNEETNDEQSKKEKYLIRKDITLHELIFRYGKMFEGYYELARYAEYKGIKVYNASEYSWINVFERKKLG